MKFTIIGAGAIGGLAGAYMAKAGHDVLLVDRWSEHVDAINSQGLFIDGVRGSMTIPVRATTPQRLSGRSRRCWWRRNRSTPSRP